MSAFWRLVPEERGGDPFSGEGAALEGGRWNEKGQKAVYLAESLALAALEVLVHLSPEEAEDRRYLAFRMDVDEGSIETPTSLPADWRSVPEPASTRSLGAAWLRKGSGLALRLPSVLVPIEYNFMVNPAAEGFARLRPEKPIEFSFDSRLWK